MTPETDMVPPEPVNGGGGGGGGGWVRPVALVASCLVIGFVGGWVLRGDDGTVTVLAPAAPADTGATGTVTTGGGTTAPASTTGAGSTTAPAAPAAPPDRADISLAVLNGTNETGLAASVAGQAEGLGYSGVTAGNAPTTSEPSTVYYRPGQRAAAQRVAKDLQIGAVEALPGSGSLAAAVPDGVDVALVLGTG